LFPLALPQKASLTVITRDFRVGLSQAVVPHGVPIAVTVHNAGKTQHEAVPEMPSAMDHPLRYHGKVEAIENVAPGRSKTGTWFFARPGLYKIACHVAGHYRAGMHVTIRVR
jgi:uncharacterized cupredoxin-like copper-binding protein